MCNPAKISDILCRAATCMTKRDLIGALILCTEALVICDESQKYEVLIKRSDCFDRIQEYEKALEDSQQAINYINKDKNVTVPYHRCVRYFINLGEVDNAEDFMKQYPKIFKDTQSGHKFRIEIQKFKDFLDDLNESFKDYDKCMEIISSALLIAPNSLKLLELKIRYLVLMGSHKEAKEIEYLIEKHKNLQKDITSKISQRNGDKGYPAKVSEILCRAGTCMTNRDLIGALILCTEALVICDDTQKYEVLIKRSDCFDRIQEYEKALEDTRLAINYINKKENLTVPYHRCARFFINFGEVDNAEKFMRQNPKIFKDTQGALKFGNEIQSYKSFLDNVKKNFKDHDKCMEIISSALKIAPHSLEFLTFKIKYLVLLGNFNEAKEIDQLIEKRCGKILKLSEAFKNYFDADFEKCNFETISRTLKLKIITDFDDKVQVYKNNLSLANTQMRKGNYSKAVSLLHKLFDCDDSNKKAHQQICGMLFNCYSKMNNQDNNVIKYASKIIEEEAGNVKALLARSKAYVNIEDHEKALKDFEVILQLDGLSNETRKEVSDVQRDVLNIRALADAIKSIDVDPSYWKSYSKVINCFIIVGNITQAKAYVEKMQNNIPSVDSIAFNEIPKIKKLEDHHENIIKLMCEKNYMECMKHLESALKISPQCKNYQFWMAECLVMLSRYSEAQKYISKYPNEPHMTYLKGLNSFLNDKFNESVEFFKETLRLDPKFTKALNYKSLAQNLQKVHEKLHQYIKEGNKKEAIETYTEIIGYDHENLQIKLKAYVGRGELNFDLLKYPQAFEDCSLALRLDIPDPSNIHCMKALLIRAKIHFKNKEYDFAIIDCDEILRLTKSSTFNSEAEKIRNESKQESDLKRKNSRQSVTSHYDTLQIPRGSAKAVVKEAFKNLSKQSHSDKHPNATALEKKKQDRKFQDIKEAYDGLKSIE